MDKALESIKLIPEQITQTWNEVMNLDLPQKLGSAQSVAISGMGGSIYNYYILKALFGKTLTVPLVRINNYGLPGFLNKNSLLIGSSYSGSTEEVLYNVQEAQRKSIPVIVFAAGGALIEHAKERAVPFYQFNPLNNPSQQPRMGQGYMLFGAIGIFKKLGFIKEEIDLEVLLEIKERLGSIAANAKSLVPKLIGQEIFFVAADHLAGNAHILRNQTNETAKLYADYNLLPELNHHLLEGLKNPKALKRTFICIDSELYFERNQRRGELTREVIEKNGYPVLSFQPRSATALGQFVETLIWGGYLTYELGKAYGEDPNLIPWVDYFKSKLGQFSALEN